MGNSFYFQWEFDLMEWLQTILGEAGISVVSFFSMFGEELFMIVVMGFIYWSLNKKAGEKIAIAIVLTSVWFPMIKNVTLRRRPYMDDPNIRCFRPVDPEADIYDISRQGYSFPSGHSCSSASVYGSIARTYHKKWLTAICLAATFLVGISRVCVGAHYPTDVLAGWTLGSIIVFLVPWLEKKFRNKSVLYCILVLCAIPGVFYCKTADYFTGLGMMLGFFAGLSFESKYVDFENTRKPLSMIFRVAGGILLYLVLSTLLKLPFSAEFLESDSAACYAVRVIRYAIICFTEVGVYPMLFKTKVLK